MPRQESEEDDAATQQPCFSTPTKASLNDGAGHAAQDAERMQTESDADVEKQFDESTGKKLKTQQVPSLPQIHWSQTVGHLRRFRTGARANQS